MQEKSPIVTFNRVLLSIVFLCFFINSTSAESAETLLADYEIDNVNGQTIYTCSGNFYDDGGSGSNYLINKDYTVTFCSDDGNPISIEFTSFYLEYNSNCNYDYLRIYDGANASTSQIGKYCGTYNPPGTIVSSGTCLHFVFHSDGSEVFSGWEASISCIAPPACDDGNTGNCCSETLPSNSGFESTFTASEQFPNSSYPVNSMTGSFSNWFYADGGYNSNVQVLIDDPTKASEGDQFVYIPLPPDQSGPYNYCIGNSMSYSSSVTSCGNDEWFDNLRYVCQVDWAPFNKSVPNGGTGSAYPAIETQLNTLDELTLYDENGSILNSGITAVNWDNISTSWTTVYALSAQLTNNSSLTYYISNSQGSTTGLLIDNSYFAPLRISGAGLDNVDMGTSTNQITFTLNPESNLGPIPNINYDVCVNNDYTISPLQGTYGQSTTFTLTKSVGNFNSGDPFSVDVVVKDEINTDCFVTAQVINPFPSTSAIGNRVWLDENTDGIQDAGEPGIPGVTLNLIQGGITIASTITDANGGYIFKDLDNDTYTVAIDNSSLPSGLILIYDEDNGTSSPNGQSTASVNKDDEYVTLDFGYNYISKSNTDSPSSMSAKGALGDRIWNDANGDGIQDPGESGIAGVTINLLTDLDFDGVYENNGVSTVTDQRGNYIFENLDPAAYMIEVVTTSLSGYNTTPTSDPDDDGDNYMDPVIIAPGDLWLGGDFGYTSDSDPADIGSRVYIDINGNGSYDIGEQGINGVSIVLINDSNKDGDWDLGEEVISTMYTINDGRYLFPDLPNDDYIVHISDTDNLLHKYDNTGDPDGGNDGYSQVLINGSDRLSENFGYAPLGHTSGKGFIGDLIYLDQDADGNYDAGEPGIEDVLVYLLDDATGKYIATTLTDEYGKYFFGNLDDGDYSVQVQSSSIPSGLSPSDDPDNSSPANNEGGAITITGGSNNLSQDFGYEASTLRTISGTIWEDKNAEGTLDGSENNRFENVTIILMRSDGNIIANTTTDASGNYSFTGIPSGSYTVEVTDNQSILLGYWHSEGTNSKSDPIVVDVTLGNATGIDFGYYSQGAAIGNLVWLDYNGDGIQDSDEPGLEGATISLSIDYNNDSNPDVLAVVKTGLTGDYGFKHLLLDEDYQGDGVGTEPSFELIVDEPNATFNSSLTYQGANTNNDSDDHSGTAAQPVQGANDISKSNTSDTQSSFDFAYEFDCSNPSTNYAMSNDGTDSGASITTSHVLGYHQGKLTHIDQVNQKYGTIRSYTYCVHNGWRYYYNPLEPDEYLFAIRMNSMGGALYNTTEIEYIEIRLDDTPSDRYSPADTEFASFAMVRDWNIKTIGDVAFTQPIDIRFYFPEEEFAQMYSAAVDKAVNDWGVNTPSIDSVQWFQKDVFDINNDIDNEGLNLDAYENTELQSSPTTFSGVNTSDIFTDGSQLIGNNKNHIQFNGITNYGGGTSQITIQASSLLPVELSRFEGTVEGCNIRLTWTSESEENFSHYEIERSTDRQNFETLGQVNGGGGLFSATYQFLDNNTSDNNYYRLKMVDNDGTFEYSKTINIVPNCDVIDNVLVYPNPVSNQHISIKIKSRSEVTEKIQIVDLFGRELKTLMVNLNEGFNDLEYNPSDLNDGIYIIKIGKRKNIKFTKISEN